MNYETIKTQVAALIKAAQEQPRTRVDAALEPIRESLLEARRKGVRLRDLYDAVKAEAKDISASSFAKYAQRHLQVKKQRGRSSASQSAPPAQTPKQVHVETNFQEAPKQPRPQAGKPRIATGDY